MPTKAELVKELALCKLCAQADRSQVLRLREVLLRLAIRAGNYPPAVEADVLAHVGDALALTPVMLERELRALRAVLSIPEPGDGP